MINVNMFRKQYIVRRYGEQTIVNGYPHSSHNDIKMLLNVQNLTPDELQALPEGERSVKHIKTYGPSMLQPSDENTSITGDRLYYHDYWYKCKSSNQWEYNLFSLAHFESVFVILPPNEQKLMGAPEL